MPGTQTSKKPAKKATTRVVSDAQRKAMSEGRTQSAAIRSYLEALEATQGPKKRGRRRTPESIQKRLGVIRDQIPLSDPLARVKLVQERQNLEKELDDLTSSEQIDLSGLEEQFVQAVKPYSERQGISYSAWRELGVPSVLLKQAGVPR